ncbi:MAG: hypothetical protein ABJB12_20715 [Pseudomonadota bacterium]
MTKQEQEAADLQTPFERTLLRSASADAPPQEATEQAWLRFSGAMGAAALAAGSLPNASASVGWARVLSGRALKCVLLGALGGAAITAIWFRTHPTHVHESTPAMALVASVASSSARSVAEAPSDVAAAQPPSAPAAQHFKSASRPPRRHDTLPARAAAAARTGEPQPAPLSTLAAETAALDAARKASAQGAFQHALSLLEQFQQTFPHSELRGDAEVATIQTLQAAGDHAQAARRAMQFLAQYPNDPHSGTLKALLH